MGEEFGTDSGVAQREGLGTQPKQAQHGIFNHKTGEHPLRGKGTSATRLHFAAPRTQEGPWRPASTSTQPMRPRREDGGGRALPRAERGQRGVKLPLADGRRNFPVVPGGVVGAWRSSTRGSPSSASGGRREPEAAPLPPRPPAPPGQGSREPGAAGYPSSRPDHGL